MMKTAAKHFFVWLPRIATMFFIILVSSFTFDFAGKQLDVIKISLDKLKEMLPAIVILLCLFISWRFRLFGGILFLMVGASTTVYFSAFKEPYTLMVYSLPILLLGLIFVSTHFVKTE